MKIDAIADLHGHQPELEGGDLLIVAGDCTSGNKCSDWFCFWYWLDRLKYKYKIVVAGNHDEFLISGAVSAGGDYYLQDNGCDIDGLKIWGSPWTPRFPGQNPKAMAFTDERENMAKYWAAIPEGLDILVTHGPPYGVLDAVVRPPEPFMDMLVFDHCGDESLQAAVRRAKSRCHVYGHIHSCGGRTETLDDTRCYNVSCVNEHYELVRGATRIGV